MSFFGSLKHHLLPTRENAYRPHALGGRWLVFFLAVSLAAEGFLMASLVSRHSGYDFVSAVIASDIVTLTNTERQSASLRKLSENPVLMEAAKRKAQDMAARGYFSHNGPDGKTPWKWFSESGYNYRYAGENLAVRFTDSGDVVRAWMGSPSHKANVVKSVYTDIGVGVASGLYRGEPAVYVVQFFGSPRDNGAAVATAKGPSELQSALNQVARLLAEPRGAASGVLGSVAGLLVALMVLAVVLHARVQVTERLLPAGVVAAIALLFLTVNTTLLSPPASDSQTAGVGFSSAIGEVVIGEDGAVFVP